MKNILCITAHPDDDILFAGTLIKLKNKGWNIYEAILTGGEGGVSITDGISDLKKHRETEAQAFANKIGTTKIYQLDEPDGFLTKNPEVLEKLISIIREVKPKVVILLPPYDYHTDHRAAHEIGLHAVELANRHAYTQLGEVIALPVVLVSDGLNTHVEPDILVDTADYHEKKMDALKTAYASQIDEYLERHTNGIAILRGSRNKTKYAEGFLLEKISSRSLITAINIEALKDLLS